MAQVTGKGGGRYSGEYPTSLVRTAVARVSLNRHEDPRVRNTVQGSPVHAVLIGAGSAELDTGLHG